MGRLANSKPAREETAAPFLKWIGGKRQIAKLLLKLVPPGADQRPYWEPFLGAGTLFFSLRPKKAILSDANKHLVNCFREVKRRPKLLSRYLGRLSLHITKKRYLQVRRDYNRAIRRKWSTMQAARFIFLNKTCFNGIFRVNSRGEFNVPYGRRRNPAIPSAGALANASSMLRKARVRGGSFEEIIHSARKGDFVYLDPPYPPLNGTAYFTHYTKNGFTKDDQETLAAAVLKLKKRGCLVMVSNADMPLTRRLYRGWYIRSLPVIRYVTCKAKKHKVRELVITNYRPPRKTARSRGVRQ